MTDPEAWRTDPRERLLAAIDRTWARGELDATPEQLVDAYAHLLAEQIRGKNRTRFLGADGAADLIDPKVQP